MWNGDSSQAGSFSPKYEGAKPLYRKKTSSFIQRRQDNLDPRPKDYEYKRYEEEVPARNDFYSPNGRKYSRRPSEIRVFASTLMERQSQQERRKDRIRKTTTDYTDYRQKSPGPDYKQELKPTRNYPRSPSPIRSCKYDLSVSSVSVVPSYQYGARRRKYTEQTVSDQLPRQDEIRRVSRNYDNETLIRDLDKMTLKDKYKDYLKQSFKANTSIQDTQPNDKGYSYKKSNNASSYKLADYSYNSPKSAKQEHSLYDISTDYYNRKTTQDNDKYSSYKLPSFEAVIDKPTTEFAKKGYNEEKSPSARNDDSQYSLSRSNVSKTNSKSKLSARGQNTEPLRTKESLSGFARNLSNISAKKEVVVTIRDFQLGKVKGEGKFGKVYMAIHTATQSIYAIKKIPKEMIKNHMLQNQLALQIKLQSYLNHSNVLKLYGFFDDYQNIYLVLQYMEEGTLFQFLRKSQNKLTQKDVSLKIRQVSSAIKYLHELDIAHRDIKPENIVLSNGVAKLCDFGWATRCTDRRKTYCGTFDYAAPEILQGREYDWCVDLWCLGVLTFQLLTGKVPFYHISRKQTMKKILSVDRDQIVFPTQTSYAARDFVESLIKKDPHERRPADQLLSHIFLKQQKTQSFVF